MSWGEDEQHGHMLEVDGRRKFWYWFRRGQELNLSWASNFLCGRGRDCSVEEIAGGLLFRTGFSQREAMDWTVQRDECRW